MAQRGRGRWERPLYEGIGQGVGVLGVVMTGLGVGIASPILFLGGGGRSGMFTCTPWLILTAFTISLYVMQHKHAYYTTETDGFPFQRTVF